MGRSVNIPWVVVSIIPLVEGQTTMGKIVDIPWVGGQNAMDRGSTYHGYGGRYTMVSWV